jgi:hypothetical protein
MSNVNYDKIRHLVDVDDDILAVFTVRLGNDRHIEDLSIAKNANVSKDYIDNIYADSQEEFRSKEEASKITLGTIIDIAPTTAPMTTKNTSLLREKSMRISLTSFIT